MSPENPARTSPEALSSRQEKSRGSLEFSFIKLHQSTRIPEKVRRIPWRAVITRPFPSKWLEHLDDNFISIPIVLSVSPWNDSSEKKRAEKKKKEKGKRRKIRSAKDISKRGQLHGRSIERVFIATRDIFRVAFIVRGRDTKEHKEEDADLLEVESWAFDDETRARHRHYTQPVFAKPVFAWMIPLTTRISLTPAGLKMGCNLSRGPAVSKYSEKAR